MMKKWLIPTSKAGKSDAKEDVFHFKSENYCHSYDQCKSNQIKCLNDCHMMHTVIYQSTSMTFCAIESNLMLQTRWCIIGQSGIHMAWVNWLMECHMT